MNSAVLEQKLEGERLMFTAPSGMCRAASHRHPLTPRSREIVDIFSGLWLSVARDRRVESDH